MEKLIVFAALGYPGTANPALPAMPATWEELVESAVAAGKAGASIVHFHGPHDKDGKIVPDRWGRLVEEIRKRCDVLIDFGQAGAPLEQRKPLLQLGTGKPDFLAVSLTNHDYRRRHQERGDYDVYYQHPRQELEEYARCCLENGVKPHWEIWHLGGLWNLEYLAKQGLVAKPYWLELLFGTPGGSWSPPTIEEINHRINHLSPDSVYSVTARGTAGPIGQTRMLTFVIIKGGHVRLGTQDIAYYSEGVPAKSNAQIVERIVRVATELGREVATPDDTRRILHLPPAQAR
ncbi:MAG: 3-keto-5-aminohexanoate cleavage protein [Deltaproteobacteria bacterium]|nr:3-keto-5-aminohexanoate cleavage protein [Deltaproteobacteria bacterium]